MVRAGAARWLFQKTQRIWPGWWTITLLYVVLDNIFKVGSENLTSENLSKIIVRVGAARWLLPKSQRIWPGWTRRWAMTILYVALDNILKVRSENVTSNNLRKIMVRVRAGRWLFPKSQRIWPGCTRRWTITILYVVLDNTLKVESENLTWNNLSKMMVRVGAARWLFPKSRAYDQDGRGDGQ